ncbi:MAG: alpha/beta hydrolase [Clostridia bacterium]|nr:alpha/beta hydrolase [Clostridia bacterium]
MKKHKKQLVKLAATTAVIAVALFAALYGVSHLKYERSVMATLAEVWMIIIDRDAIYEEGDGYIENMELREKTNLEPHEIPSGVSMDIPYYYEYEHNMQVYYFNMETFTDTLLIYIPGGGYLNNPLKYHWKLINNVSQNAECPVVMPIYPKLPHYTCEQSYEAMMEFYLDVASREGVKHIIFAGDSSGGAMSLVLAQKIRDLGKDILEPEQLFLYVPWMDVTMENEEVIEIEPVDHMLGLHGLIDIGKKWAADLDRKDPVVSPIYGTFENLGYITLFTGTRDMLCPDIVKFSEILTEQGIEHTFILKEGLDHPYPLFPTPEAKEAQQMLIDAIIATKGK